MSDWEPMSPACMKCEQVTGKSTCFPGPCVFFHERNTPGTKAHNVATLDRIRRGMREPVYASAIPTGTAETACPAPFMGSAMAKPDAQGDVAPDSAAPDPSRGGMS